MHSVMEINIFNHIGNILFLNWVEAIKFIISVPSYVFETKHVEMWGHFILFFLHLRAVLFDIKLIRIKYKGIPKKRVPLINQRVVLAFKLLTQNEMMIIIVFCEFFCFCCFY